MIFVDLDNTLYNQEQYLKFVFKEIGKHLKKRTNINKEIIYKFLFDIVKAKTMSFPIFDYLVKYFRLDIDPRELVELYREFSVLFLKSNKLCLYESALKLLKRCDVIIYTEGNEEIQIKKIENIEKNYKFKLNYIIVKNKLDKGNVKIFRKYNPVAYIGDDVFRDFYIPNMLNILTIRVLTGLYKNIPNNIVKKMYRPKITVKNLSYLRFLYYESNVHKCSS